MSIPQNSPNSLFIDYVPAELRENKVWRIIYYVKHPITGKLQIKNPRVKPLKSITERRKLAKRMIIEINNRLASGWNPFYDNKGAKEFVKLHEVIDLFLKRTKIEFVDNNLRIDTYKTYKSQINVLKTYLELKNVSEMMCFKFNQEFVGEYLDWVRYDKGCSARTRDNYLGFLRTLCSFLLSKRYITANPTEHFNKINKNEKNRVLISKKLRTRIFDHLKTANPKYLLICLCCYYCLVRRTELTKIKVKDFNPIKNTLWIGAAESKNRKGNHVTVPRKLNILLMEHINGAHQEDFLFSGEKFYPGAIQCRPDHITRKWSQLRTKLSLDSKIDWYSLKDTGITDLLKAGVPLITVRDQARHHSSKQTDAYTPRNLKNADASILSAKINFREI